MCEGYFAEKSNLSIFPYQVDLLVILAFDLFPQSFTAAHVY